MDKVQKTDEEWRSQLTPQQFSVAREKGTEPAFTGDYWDNHEKGVYRCVCCGAELFDSDTKFESGTGWPSFFAPVDKEKLALEEDSSYGMRPVRRAPGARFPGRPSPYRTAVLHELGGIEFREETLGIPPRTPQY